MAVVGESAQRRQDRRDRAAEAAESSGGVLSRRALLALGIDRWEIAAELRARRWQRLGPQTVRVSSGDQATANFYRAIAEVGSPAVLDGVSALLAAGLQQWAEEAVHVAVPKSATPQRCRGVVVHETRRYEASSVIAGQVPRMRPATAAVHAALWAVTDRQGATVVLMAAQQRLFSAAELAEEVDKVKWSRRRRLLRDLALAVGGGIETLGEREFATLCTKRGLPAPDRQVRRRTDSGTWVYDNTWDVYGVTAEVDGSQHREPAAWIPDALKQNAAALGGHVVLRIPNLALRVDPEPFLDQLEAALRAGGWSGPRRSA
jgi:very-short-patch-repair endonuclease